MNDINKQAHKGRIAAIIEILNQEMTDLGVTNRAIYINNILQLLCEAKNAESLEKSIVVSKVRGILESISPPNIRRVHINSRIRQEKQLLWLEDITQDPENQLLWSEKIILKKPNIFYKISGSNPRDSAIESLSNQPKSSQIQQNLIWAIAVTVVLILMGFLLYNALQFQLLESLQSQSQNDIKSSPQPPEILSSAQQFSRGVKIAEEAASEGKFADTRQEWLEIAQKWQQAADSMEVVSPDFERYATAQNRAALYRRNQEQAQQEEVQQEPTDEEFGNAIKETEGMGVVAGTQSMNELQKRTAKDPKKGKIVAQASRAVNALKSLFPNMNIVVHESDESYNKAMGTLGGTANTRGQFVYKPTADGNIQGAVHINLDRANARTIASDNDPALMFRTVIVTDPAAD
jgi:hypothetical protein